MPGEYIPSRMELSIISNATYLLDTILVSGNTGSDSYKDVLTNQLRALGSQQIILAKLRHERSEARIEMMYAGAVGLFSFATGLLTIATGIALRHELSVAAISMGIIGTGENAVGGAFIQKGRVRLRHANRRYRLYKASIQERRK